MSRTPVARHIAKTGTLLVTMQCVNERCKWYDTQWYVQVNPDGTVPVPDHAKETNKAYPNLVSSEEERRFVDGVARQLVQEQALGGGEIGGLRRGRS